MFRAGDVRNAYRIFVERIERTKSLGRPWYRLKCTIKKYLKVIVWEGVDCVHIS
jgi:hypothetical protein